MTKAISKETTSQLIERGLANPKLDPGARAYGKACVDGEKQAELYLDELRLDPDLIGMPVMASYIDKIQPHPEDPRIRGLPAGFLGRVEREFAPRGSGSWHNMTRDQATKMFEGLSQDARDKLERMLNWMVALEAHEKARENDGDCPTGERRTTVVSTRSVGAH